MEANILPGPWYPCGLITPHYGAIGVTIPGIGGMIIGSTEHITGGVISRQFAIHTTDQVASFMNGSKMNWGFSNNAVKEHTRDTLTLNPQ